MPSTNSWFVSSITFWRLLSIAVICESPSVAVRWFAATSARIVDSCWSRRNFWAATAARNVSFDTDWPFTESIDAMWSSNQTAPTAAKSMSTAKTMAAPKPSVMRRLRRSPASSRSRRGRVMGLALCVMRVSRSFCSHGRPAAWAGRSGTW